MKTVLFAVASLVAFAVAGAANAADLGRPVYKTPPPVPPPVQDWSGIYVGLEGGYGWGQQSTDAIDPGDQFSPVFTPFSGVGTFLPPVLTVPLFFPDVAVPSVNQNGWLFGGFLGAQKQFGNWVFGFESDIDGANIKGSGTASASSTSTGPSAAFLAPTGTLFTLSCLGVPCFTLNHNVSIDSKIDALASIRGKVGWSFTPDWLIYGTGGAAFADIKSTVISTESSVTAPSLTSALLPCSFGGTLSCTLSPTTNILQNTSGRSALFGWAAGGGVDWKYRLDAGSALVFGVEYLHYGFPEQTIGLTGAGGSFAFRAKENVDAIKGRISYLFSMH